VYALAATVAWMLLGGAAPLAEPLSGPALLAAIGERGMEPRRLEPLPAPLRDVLRGLLRHDPAHRVGDLAALAAALGPAGP
jgi:hypothetical protein